MSPSAGAVLSVSDLTLEFRTRGGTVHALEDVGFEVFAGETVGLVGESGSGKSVTAYAVMGILDPAARVLAGHATFEGIDTLASSEATLRGLRGGRIAMIFQNPRSALNPIRAVGRQIEDALMAHRGVSRAEARTLAIHLLTRVRIPDPMRRYHAYPFELSGGMCQRVMIAIALAGSPSLLIADEPTTGLDVTTQAVIMDLVSELVAQQRMATLLITHDLALAAEYCDRIVVMHAGHVVEAAPTRELFARPRHPYTERLIRTTPDPRVGLAALQPIAGGLPDLRAALPPCRFSMRCDRHRAECDQAPLRRTIEPDGRMVACWRA